jgi:glycine dehydrogenase subunit 1
MRYLPLTPNDRTEMLAKIGVKTTDELFKDVPTNALLKNPVDLPHHQSEIEVEGAIRAMAAKNLGASSVPSFLGAGAYRHHVPASVDYIIQRGEFLTSYTPYQPEIAQGTLQYLFEFQTQVALITGMEVANASLYDGSTACVEAVQMANRVTKRAKAILSGALHPHYREVVETHGKYSGFAVHSLSPSGGKDEDLTAHIDDQTSCVVVQYPCFYGEVSDLTKLANACHAKGAYLIVAVTEIVALGAIKPPGEMGADIVVAEGQSIGNALNFGGPYVGLFAARERDVRQMPGRLCGQTVDANGQRGFVLTLSTREQHIRREKATSNICTNSGLCALAFTIHMSLLGEDGYRKLAELNHAKAAQLAEKLSAIKGVSIETSAFFNEFTVKLPKPAAGVVDALVAKKILGGVPISRFYDDADLANLLLVTATECTTEADMDALVQALREVL